MTKPYLDFKIWAYRNIKRSVTSKGTGTRTSEVTTIAWCNLSSLANNVLMIRDSYCL